MEEAIFLKSHRQDLIRQLDTIVGKAALSEFEDPVICDVYDVLARSSVLLKAPQGSSQETRTLVQALNRIQAEGKLRLPSGLIANIITELADA